MLRALKDRHNSCLWPALCRRKYPRKHSKAVTLLLSTCPTAGHDSQVQTPTHVGVKDSWKDDQTSIIKLMGFACTMLLCWKHGLLVLHTVLQRAPGGKTAAMGTDTPLSPLGFGGKTQVKELSGSFSVCKDIIAKLFW